MPTQLNDYEVARICFNLYIEFPDINRFWDKIWAYDGGYAALKRVGDVDVVVWRGSTTAYDWYLNLKAEPVEDGSLGMLHKGFALGVWKLQDDITRSLRGRVIVAGHSRGAAQATIFAGHLAALGKAPERLVVFGSPRPGYAKLAGILKGVKISSYKNRSDPITNVPFNIDLPGRIADFDYVHVCDMIKLDVKIPDIGAWPGDLYDHHWQNYYEGVRRTVCPSVDKDLVSILTLDKGVK